MADNTTSSKDKAKQLLSSLSKKPTKPAASKASRPEMEMSIPAQNAFRRFIPAQAIAELVEARRDQEKEALDEACFEEWTERLWKSKTRPANPTLKLNKDNGSLDMSAIFQVHERYSLNIPQVPEGKEVSEVVQELFVELLGEAGMDRAEATKAAEDLATKELDFTPKTFIDFNKLVNGHYEGEGKNRTFVEASESEQGIASKVLSLLQARTKEELATVEPLTDDEAGQVIETKYSVVVKPGFLQRVFTYVKSLEQVRAVFRIIKPVRYPSHVKFAVSDTPEEKNKRFKSEFEDILGISSE